MLKEDLKEAKRLLYVCRDLVGGPGSGGLLSHIDGRLRDVAVRTEWFESREPFARIIANAVYERKVEVEGEIGPVVILKQTVETNDSLAIGKNVHELITKGFVFV